MDFKDRYVYPEFDYDNTLWRWINKTLEETDEKNAEKLLKLVRVMQSDNDKTKWKDEIKEDIEKREIEIEVKYEKKVDEKLTFYYEDDDYSRAIKFNAQKNMAFEVGSMKANLILDYIMDTDCIENSFERRQKHLSIDKV